MHLAVWEWTHETLHIISSFQHALEPLVDRVCAVQEDKEFLYKRDSQGKLVTRHRRLADPSHDTAIKSFRKTEQEKSKLPQAFWAKSWKKKLVSFLLYENCLLYALRWPPSWYIFQRCAIQSKSWYNMIGSSGKSNQSCIMMEVK